MPTTQHDPEKIRARCQQAAQHWRRVIHENPSFKKSNLPDLPEITVKLGLPKPGPTSTPVLVVSQSEIALCPDAAAADGIAIVQEHLPHHLGHLAAAYWYRGKVQLHAKPWKQIMRVMGKSEEPCAQSGRHWHLKEQAKYPHSCGCPGKFRDISDRQQKEIPKGQRIICGDCDQPLVSAAIPGSPGHMKGLGKTKKKSSRSSAEKFAFRFDCECCGEEVTKHYTLKNARQLGESYLSCTKRKCGKSVFVIPEDLYHQLDQYEQMLSIGQWAPENLEDGYL